jgi:hypothetical protein
VQQRGILGLLHNAAVEFEGTWIACCGQSDAVLRVATYAGPA